ncbi:hypothetical protein BBJ29_008620 [Phytophthora kernoviae]|uniref:ABC transporter domain-containing protein n=1 Tax=Phytophthora kernoviae TaxID=325452 RepID=A0A3F2RDB0_9STRA|nr:hypothetical protein BBP00_00009199 [Phytophthora kernoviae]RLN58036.1 hypothetical protein BBJ29_008620 [Phytophthora kernoviae]
MKFKIETALGHAIPQMDVRFKHLSLSIDIVVVDDNGPKHELPTLPNELKKIFEGPEKRKVRKILKDISGVFALGKLTLLLGQSGSGKSALIEILSGRFSMTKNITVEGDISYNNVPREDIIKALPQFVTYILRRGEELLSKGSEELASIKAVFEHCPEIVIQQLGLHNCQDTVVGDAMMRGISSGERKRVTTGELGFSMKYIQHIPTSTSQC